MRADKIRGDKIKSDKMINRKKGKKLNGFWSSRQKVRKKIELYRDRNRQTEKMERRMEGK